MMRTKLYRWSLLLPALEDISMEEILQNKIHKGKTFYSEEQVISMLEFPIDNIFVSFRGTWFQQVVGIPMGTNCAPHMQEKLEYCCTNLEYL
jgi:hypothetical protein